LSITTSSSFRQLDPDEVVRALRGFARVIAPLVAAELQRDGSVVPPAWDDATCRLYADQLSPDVAKRAIVLFEALANDGKIESRDLAKRLDVKTPKALSGFLTTSLKRHANKLGLPLPFDGGEGSKLFGGIPNPADGDDPQRTYWVDRDGIAGRMVVALRRRVDEAAPKVSRPRFSVVVQHDPMPDMGMGSERAEELKRRLTALGAKADNAIFEEAVYAVFEIEAADEDEASVKAIELFDQALEDAEIYDAPEHTPRAQVVEPVERIDR